MRKKFRNLLHAYRVESFKITHNNEHLEDTTQDILKFTDEALNNAYHYHFRKDPDPKRVETFNMIKNYTVDALLPPVVEKLMTRIVVLEKQQDRLLDLVHEILETLSHDDLFLDKDAG